MTVEFSLECFAEHSDEPVQIAVVRAEAVPRVGDFVMVYDKRLQDHDHYPTTFKVTIVSWEVHVDEGTKAPHGRTLVPASCSVIVEPESASVVFYCVCETLIDKPMLDDDGNCADCGRKKR